MEGFSNRVLNRIEGSLVPQLSHPPHPQWILLCSSPKLARCTYFFRTEVLSIQCHSVGARTGAKLTLTQSEGHILLIRVLQLHSRHHGVSPSSELFPLLTFTHVSLDMGQLYRVLRLLMDGLRHGDARMRRNKEFEEEQGRTGRQAGVLASRDLFHLTKRLQTPTYFSALTDMSLPKDFEICLYEESLFPTSQGWLYPP
ncbi:hypothetical protein BDP27DRAFT_156280 [Rhodocollybia butyracea]|uniref:Uncharacterized protein n=1 Tax=Rhodocollybia butyracea TaxID=206335 RepID=A0A9P5PMB8_9AGAR|nr:hypothetical protein BDP27DRAFT_156280 [Rhodocollybia butyracea]